MIDGIVEKMMVDYNLDKDTAERVLLLGMRMSDQPLEVVAPIIEPEEVEQLGTRAPAQPRPATPEELAAAEEQRPPARKVDPWWYITNTWQMLEPTVAWPIGAYYISKSGASLLAGLPMSAAAPIKLGGAKPTELFWAVRNPGYADKLQKFFKANPKALTRAGATRPKLPTVPKTSKPPVSPGTGGGTFGSGGLGGASINLLALPGVIATFENLAVSLGQIGGPKNIITGQCRSGPIEGPDGRCYPEGTEFPAVGGTL